MENGENNTADEVIRLLKDYRERREKFRISDEYDEAMAGMRGSARSKIEKLDEPLKKIASRLFDIIDRGFFLYQVCDWKLDYLAAASIQSIESKNPLALANCVRALLEHLAAMLALVEKLKILEKGIHGQGNERKINELFEKAEKFIHRSYYGCRDGKGESSEEAFHINDYLKVLNEKEAVIKEEYDFLCEYVHPNYGSNTLVSSGDIASGRLNPPEAYNIDTLNRLRRCCSICMTILRDGRVEHAVVFIRLQSVLENCFSAHASVTTAFTQKHPTPQGDGKSRETAYHFPRARNASEAVEWSYDFLKKQGVFIREKYLGDITTDFIYDVFVTDNGSVWFKIPSTPPHTEEKHDTSSS